MNLSPHDQLMAIRIEPDNTASGRAVAVGGKAFVRAPNGVGKGYPAVGSNQSGNVVTAPGTLRLGTDHKTVEFVPDSAAAFAAVKAADEATGTDA